MVNQTTDSSIGGKEPVPKFASFRPKEQVGVQVEKAHVANPPKESPSRERRHQHHRTSNTSLPNSNYDGRQTNRPGRVEPKPTIIGTIPKHDSIQPFTIDSEGDPNNVKYGSLHRYVVPSYYRSGAGNVVGIRRSKKIDRNVSNEKAIVLSEDRFPAINRNGRISFPELNISSLREARVRIDPSNDNYGKDFISVHQSPTRKRKREDDDDSHGTSESENDRTLYAPIEQGSKKALQPSDLDLVYTNLDSALAPRDQYANPAGDALRRRSIGLSQHLNTKPNDCNAWLTLIELQDEIIGLGKGSAASKPTVAERQSNAAVKISMYEKALGKVEDPRSRENLMLGMMEEGSQIWDADKLSRRWQTALQDNPTYHGLWKHYLNFQQTTFLSFRLEEVTNAYLNCFNVLRHAQNNLELSCAERDAVVESQIYVVLRMSMFMREGGFSEHAVAIWQSILEFNICRPTRLQRSGEVIDVNSSSEMLSAFREFWDSELPRIGEVDAAGWAAFDSRSAGPSSPNEDIQPLAIDPDHVFRSWAKQEHLQALQSRLPARTTDDVEEDDPRRVILFSDIEDILINVGSSSGRDLLIQAFLVFCNLPSLPNGVGKTSCTSWCTDLFLRNEALYGSHGSLSSWQMQLCKDESDTKKHGLGSDSGAFNGKGFDRAFDFGLVDYQVASDTLFSGQATWYLALESWQRAYSGDEGPVNVPWIHRALRIIVDLEVHRSGLAELLLAFELRISPHTVRKTAKNLIKKQPSNLPLYNAYALIEYRLGNVANAEKAMAAAINMTYAPSGSLTHRLHAVFLWRTWIWELLDAGQYRQALMRILTYADREIIIDTVVSEEIRYRSLPANPTGYQKTLEELSKNRNQAISEGLWKEAILYVELLILYTYLTDTDPLPSAISTFTANLGLLSTRLSPTSLFHELLHQSFARLVHYHATHTALFQPSLIRSCLAESIALFPHNTIFLSLYAWNESRFRIDDRVRSIMRDVVLANKQQSKEESVISHFFAIYTELNRGVALGSNIHAVRGTFERAVESKCGAHNAGLWKLYFVFERDNRKLQRAKAVFHRAMRACPWVKDIYMLAFEGLRDVMDERELMGVYNMLGEKELRVHVSLEDVLQR